MKKLNGKITAIIADKKPGVQRSNIFLDGKFAFSLDYEVILKEYLKVGRNLSQAEVMELTRADQYQRCLNASFHFLAYRPRSEAEVRQQLQRRGYESQDIEKTISELKRLDLINDTTFAEFWKDNRNFFRPRSQRMVKQELREKGVDTAVIDETVESIDDWENAYKAAAFKARTLPITDYEIFRHRLSGYLQRRGFNYGVINNIVKQTWKERTSRNQDNGEPSIETEILE
jgi:regulatory protein